MKVVSSAHINSAVAREIHKQLLANTNRLHFGSLPVNKLKNGDIYASRTSMLLPCVFLPLQGSFIIGGWCLSNCQFQSRSYSEGNETRQVGNTSKILARTSNKKIQFQKETLRNGDMKNILWWDEQIKLCKRPVTKEMSKRLDHSNVLGLDASLRNGSLKEGTLNSELLDVKRKFPHEVLLCRVGEFYEAVGFDACMIVEYAGLNPMSGLRNDTIPRAGCPVMNLRQTIDELTRHGFSVCIMEEVQGPSQARQRKDRFVSGHAHPGSPYVYGLAGANLDVEFPEPIPVVGISRSTRGYCLVSVLEMMRTYLVEDGLTEEAIIAKIRSKQCQRLFLHRSLRDDISGTVRWGKNGDGGLLWGECKDKIWGWLDKDIVPELLSKVKELYDIEPEENFREILPSATGGPHPLYVGTASQIGILPTPGIPSLLKVLLPSDCNGLCMIYLRDLLLNPPPYEVAKYIQAACRLMSTITTAVPDFICVPAAKLVKLIGAREANYVEFCRLRKLSEDILYMYSDHSLRSIFDLLLEPTWLATGLRMETEQLVKDCNFLIDRVSTVLSYDGDPDQIVNKSEHIPDDFFLDLESSWRCHVKRDHVKDVFEEVDKAAFALTKTVESDFVPVVARTKAVLSSLAAVSKGEICYNREHQAVWFKGKRFSPSVWSGSPGEAEIKRLEPALDLKGKRVGDDWYTTAAVDSALLRYKNAAEQANNLVTEVLRELADELKAKLNTIIFVSVFCIIAKTLFGHVSEGRRRGWAFPDLGELMEIQGNLTRTNQVQTTEQCSVEKTAQLVLHDLVPYWLDTSQEVAVPSSFEMSSLFLLTGPNGGGKSSMLRSICAAALLGICGLMIPAKAALVPKLDAIILRMMSQDSPVDAKSSFQVEMAELRTILQEATRNSLVLVDELCRGTEVQKGTSIVGAVLEALDEIECIGVLSTHLHGLLDMKLNVKNVVLKAMAIEDVNGKVQPTWKLVDGACRESLAYEVALKEGIPYSLIDRANSIYKANYVKYGLNAVSNPVGIVLDESSVQSLKSSIANSSNGEAINCVAVNENKQRHQDGSQNKAHKAGLPQTISKEGFKHAETLFLQISQEKLGEIIAQMPSSPNVSATDMFMSGFIDACQQPPPVLTNKSCVYMLHRPDRKFYVGQTDNLKGRIMRHRSLPGMRDVPFVYIVAENKSIASLLETLLINELCNHGLELVNKSDQNHQHFGRGLLVNAPPF